MPKIKNYLHLNLPLGAFATVTDGAAAMNWHAADIEQLAPEKKVTARTFTT